MTEPAKKDIQPGKLLAFELADRISDAERAVQQTLGAETDVVIDSFGHMHLLPQAQTALQQSEERFRTLFEKDTNVFFLLDRSGCILYESPSVTAMLGYGTEELVCQDFFGCLHAEGRGKAKETFSRLLQVPQAPITLTQRYRHKDGSYRWLEGTGTNLLEEPGIRAVVYGLHDVTERIKTETSLRESEQWLTAIFEHAAVGIAEVNAQTGRFVRVNTRFCELLGYPKAEFEQLTFRDITHPLEIAQDIESVARLRDGSSREFTRDKRYMRKDGAIVWANVAVSAIGVPGQKPTTLIAVAQDITERKRIEDHFLQAQKMEALGQFSGGVAHDFNNILTAIMGYSELALLKLKDNPVVSGHIASVLKAGNRASDLVRQILTFSRQEPQARKSIPLQPVVAESVKLLRATIPSSIQISLSSDSAAPTVLADANQIHQVLTNLGVNAWHAMKDSSGRIKVKLDKFVVDGAAPVLQPGLRPGIYARISLSDSGCGMSPEIQKRIFEPFFTTKLPGEGTGLGLSVVHGIMENHDGAITVESAPGEGTVFTLFFPAHAYEATAADFVEGDIPRGNGERVLIVDDEKLLATMIQEALTALGYAVETSLDPTAALALVRADPGHFSLIITDQTMPVMTGLSLATQIHRTMPVLPILLMTGYSASVTRERVEAAGVRDVVSKPTTVRSLGEAVHAAIAGKPPVNSGSAAPYRM